MPRSTRSSDAPKEPLGRLSFNTTAARQLFPETAKGVRLRLDRGAVSLHAAKAKRGVDVIAIERRPREVLAEIEPGTLSRQVMRRLYKAGLTEQEPYFVLTETTARGWFNVDHVPDHQAPRRQPVMTVSGFDPPPTPIDMTHWRRFLKAATSDDKQVDGEEWETTRRMILSAERITSRRGRHTQQRQLAERLLEAVERNAVELLAWAKRQPDYARDLIALLDELDMQPVEQEPEEEGAEDDTDAMPSPQPADEADEAAAVELLAFAEREQEDEEADGEAVASAEAGEDDTPSTTQETPPEAESDDAVGPEQPAVEDFIARLESDDPEALEPEEVIASEHEGEPEEGVQPEEGVEPVEEQASDEPNGEPEPSALPGDQESDEDTGTDEDDARHEPVESHH